MAKRWWVLGWVLTGVAAIGAVVWFWWLGGENGPNPDVDALGWEPIDRVGWGLAWAPDVIREADDSRAEVVVALGLGAVVFVAVGTFVLFAVVRLFTRHKRSALPPPPA